MNIKTRRIWGERPALVPEGHLIFNAPRPLLGDKTWQGEFVSGVFYSSIDPASFYASERIQANARLDAKLCEWVGPKEFDAWVNAFCEAEGINRSDYSNDDFEMMFFDDIMWTWTEVAV